MTVAGPLPDGRKMCLRGPEAEECEFSMTILKSDGGHSISSNGLQGLFKKTKVAVWRKPPDICPASEFQSRQQEGQLKAPT